jgi:RNase P/RNase MRP subunit p30
MKCICLPKNNETELVEIGKEFGYESFIFLYELKSKKNLIEIKTKLAKSLDVNYKVGIFFKPQNVSEIEKFNKALFIEADFICAEAHEEKLVRAIVSQLKIDMIVNIATSSGKDATHYRRSGVNQVIAKLAKSNKLIYGVSFSNILSDSKRYRLLGRIMQNQRIFSKFKVPVEINCFAKNRWEIRSKDDLYSFAKVLKVKTLKKDFGEKIKQYIRKKSNYRTRKLVRPGVKIVD